MKPYQVDTDGKKTNMFDINKFGQNLNVPKNTTEDVWDGGGTYDYPTAARITKLSQLVDQVAMRGATIELQGLDLNWDLLTQTTDLDGLDTSSAVVLTTPMIRVFRMKVLANVVGNSAIRCQNDALTKQYAIISAGNNQTLMALYTVPRSVTARMTNYYADQIPVAGSLLNPCSVEFRIWAADRFNGYEFQLKHAKATTAKKNEFQHFFDAHLEFSEMTDIKITAKPSDDHNAHVHAGFDLQMLLKEEA